MLHIPRITPVRVKTEPIAQELINPGSRGHYFPQEVGPRVVYLDVSYDYPQQQGDDPSTERERQGAIWKQLIHEGGVQFLDRRAEEDAGRAKLDEVRGAVIKELGRMDTAEFYEMVFSELFKQTMNVVVISTGVTYFTGDNYHDIGYLRS